MCVSVCVGVGVCFDNGVLENLVGFQSGSGGGGLLSIGNLFVVFIARDGRGDGERVVDGAW